VESVGELAGWRLEVELEMITRTMYDSTAFGLVPKRPTSGLASSAQLSPRP
jgi:hypothetical protein